MQQDVWEYCSLLLHGVRFYRTTRPGQIPDRSYDCVIDYFGPTGDIIRVTLGEHDTPLPYNPFLHAIAFLGASGWEICSIQHGNYPYYVEGEFEKPKFRSYNGAIDYTDAVAYFKRRAVPGRPPDSPSVPMRIFATNRLAPPPPS